MNENYILLTAYISLFGSTLYPSLPGEVGFTISQSRQTITATVSNGTRTWQGTVPAVNITYGEWMYLALLWLPQDGILLVLDGQVVSSEVSL